MAEVVLFHSVLGLRPGLIAAAERLRAAGHTVHTPDCFDGEVFDEIEDGLRKEEALGYVEIARRARESVAGLPEGLVYAGFSMGSLTPNCWPQKGLAPWGQCSCTARSPSRISGSTSASSAGLKGSLCRLTTLPGIPG